MFWILGVFLGFQYGLELEKEPIVEPVEFVQEIKKERNFVEEIVLLWMEKKFAEKIVFECKRTARIPERCIRFAVWVSNAESTLCKDKWKNNCFGLMVSSGKSKRRFNSIEEGIEIFVYKYNKFRRKHEKPEDRLKKSNYCTSGCEDWVENVKFVLNRL